MGKRPVIIEEPSKDRANELLASGEFCQPKFSEKRDCYILMRTKEAQKRDDDTY